MEKTKREKKQKVFMILTPRLLEKLEQEANAQMTSRSQIVRVAVEQYFHNKSEEAA